VDLVVSNPPYVPVRDRGGLPREIVEHEPHLALFGGESGFDIYQRLIAGARRVLQPGGWLVMELNYQFEQPVREMLSGWLDIDVQRDLAGLPRVISARLGP
jgi:release factor glutamine methyltransferase